MPHPFIAGVAYTMKMLLKILLALILCSHRTTVANSDSCEKTQCRLVPQTNDLSTTFSTTASERGVRLFYLYVKVNNNTYRPTNPGNKLRPARWAWARDIQEPMLSFSYDYDILSWGLLYHFQVRMMRVWLLDQPTGCLSNLSLPCQDRVIARALLMDVTNDYFLKEKSQKRATVQKPFVVCNIVLDEHDDEWSKLFDGNLVYRCCSNSTKRVANETSVECGLHVIVSDWLHFFYHVINYTTIPMLFFWPAIILVLPDFLVTFEDKEDAEKAPEQTGKEDTSQTPKSKNSRTNAKHHREELEESFVLLSMSETEGSYGTIVQEPCIEGNVSCFKKCLKKIICCEKTEAPPPQPPSDLGQKTHDSKRESDNVTVGETSTPSTSDQNDDHKSQETNASKRESEKVTLGETNTPSTSDQSDAVRSLIPVDDVSPITIRRLMRYCTGKSSVFCSDYSKLLFLYYILLFIIYYYKLFFSMLYKDHDLRRAINLPGARFEGQLSEWFSMTTVYFDLNPEIIIPFGLVLIVLPLILIFYIKPCDLQDLCSECGKNPFYLRTDIHEHLRSAPRQMVSAAKPFFTGGCVIALFKKTDSSRCSALCSVPSVRYFRILAGKLQKRLSCKKCMNCKCLKFCLVFVWKWILFFTCGLFCSIILSVWFIVFWCVGLALLILSNLLCFALTQGTILFWYSPFWRLFLLAWHVIRQLDTADPSERLLEKRPCLSCTYKCSLEWCKRCLKKCKQYLGYETNKRPAAGENGNTHAEQGNDSTDHSNAGNKNARAEQEIDSTDHSNAGIVCVDIWSFVLALIWASFVTIVACLSCRFVSRMTGFVIVGLFWNSKETIPYITFLYVLMNHTSCCYSSIQSRYKEIKVMISKQLRSKGSGEKIGEDGKRQGEGQSEGEGQEKGQVQDKATIFYGDNIPLDLFWFVCNDPKVLPLVDELCLMFVSVLAFAFVVFLAVAAIMFLGEENSAFPDVVTALLQAGAILISGKLPEWVFKKLIKEERFIDDEKIEKQKMVKQAVKDWLEKNPAGEV